MSFQYTYDAKGRAVGVFIPINEWEKITDELKNAKNTKRHSPKKPAVLKSIKKGMQQVAQIERGKIKSIPLQQLLDEL